VTPPEESLLRKIRRLFFEVKSFVGEDSEEELGDCDFLLLILLFFTNGIHTIFVSSRFFRKLTVQKAKRGIANTALVTALLKIFVKIFSYFVVSIVFSFSEKRVSTHEICQRPK
jgi:hypothetical protein